MAWDPGSASRAIVEFRRSSTSKGSWKKEYLWPIPIRYPVFKASGELRSEGADAALEASHEAEILFKEWDDRVHVRGFYSTLGFRPDADLMMWWIAPSAEDTQALRAAFNRSSLGGMLRQTWAFLGVHRPPEVAKDHLPAFLNGDPPGRYLNVYPFVRRPDWYLLPREKRAALLR